MRQAVAKIPPATTAFADGEIGVPRGDEDFIEIVEVVMLRTDSNSDK